EPVASHIVDRLTAHWHANPYRKPIALISQGDPIEERGISAITRLVSESLSVPRFMIYLDPYIADYHLKDADQYRVELTLPYSALLQHLAMIYPNSEALLTERINKLIDVKNRTRKELGKPPLQSYYRDFALLQEVTKAACRSLCGEITIIHTSAVIPPFSVSSFFEVGLDLGFIHPDDMIAFEAG
ncbi:MAG: shikimate kinase, partial [Halieaceae bacterium]